MKKGFTLVEMMAVIAVLGLLVLLVLPNVLKNYKDAKKISFINEAKTIYNASTDKYVTERTKGNKIGLIEQEKDSSTNPLSLAEASDLNYTIRLDSDGKVTAFKMSNAEFCIVGVGDFLGNYSKEDVIELSDEEAAQACEVTAVQNHQKFILRLQNKGTIKADYNLKIIYLKYNDGWFKDNNLHNEISEVIIPYRENNYYEGAWATNTLGSEIQAINCDGKISQDKTGGGIFTGKETKPYVEAFSKFIRKYYTVVFNGGEGSTGSMTSVKCEYGRNDCKIPSNVDANGYGKNIKKPGYLFTGWTSSIGTYNTTQLTLPEIDDSNENENPAIKFDNEKVCSGEQDIDNKVTFTATWEPITYQVAYNCTSGTGTMANTNHTYGVDANLRENTCTKTGYTFAGWARSADGNVEFGDKASVKNLTEQNNAVVTLYAKWSSNKYTITFSSNGGNAWNSTTCANPYKLNGAVCTKEVTYDGTYGNMPTPVKTGYTFGGWYKETGLTNKVEASTKVSTANNHTLYAKWSATQYTITFNVNGGSAWTSSTCASPYSLNSSACTKSVTYDGTYGNMPTPTRTGYTFGGWYKESSLTNKVETTTKVSTSSNHTLYAKWTANKYTVTYNVNGGTAWTSSTCGSGYTFSSGAKTCTKSVTYNSTYGDLPTPVRTGYTFAGWYKESSFTNKVETTTKVSTASAHTLYAKWTANKYTVTYSVNGGTDWTSSICGSGYTFNSSSKTCTKSVTYDGTYGSLPTPTRTGYAFAGWYKEASCANKVETTTKVSTASAHTLYAKWGASEYTITLNNQNATTAGTDKIYEKYNNGFYLDSAFSKKMTTSANGITSPTRTGYTFGGYYTSTGGSGTQYIGTNGKLTSSASTTNFNADGSLYAKWTANSVTVTYNVNGGTAWTSSTCGSGYTLSGSTCTKKVTYDGTYGSLPTPTRSGYTFVGWYKETSFTNKVETSTKVNKASNHTLYAKWTANSVTVTFNVNGGSAWTSSTCGSGYTFNSSSKACTKKVTYDGTYGNLPTPTRSGYTFAGWYKETSFTNKVETSTKVNNASNHTLYAKWTANNSRILASYSGGLSGTYLSSTYKSKIKTIVFETTINIPNNKKISWDLSRDKDNSVIGYLVTNSSNSSMYDLHIQANGKIIANPDSSKVFYFMTLVESITGLENLDTSKVTDMDSMFFYTGSGASTFSMGNLSNWDTSKVTNMNYMFEHTGRQASTFDLNLANWNVSNVTGMNRMFLYAGLQSSTFNLNLANWKPSKVTDMSYMFEQAGSMATTWNVSGLSNWNVSNVTNMRSMFSGSAYRATTVNMDLSKWDTSKVTDMGYMFSSVGYNATTFNLKVSNWNVSNVTNMSGMFANTGQKASTYSMNLSSWNVSKVTDMSYMFSRAGYNSTTISLNLSNWNTSKVTNMSYMFRDAGYNSQTINMNLSNWRTLNVTDMSWMFRCVGLYSTTWSVTGLSNWNTSKVTNMNNMFSYSAGYGYPTAFSLDLSSWNVSNVTNMSGMFHYAGNRAKTWNIGNLSNWNTSKVTDMTYMFGNAGSWSTTWNSIGTLKVYADTIAGLFNDVQKAKATVAIYKKPSNINGAFNGAASDSNALITVNYTSTVTNIDEIIATRYNNKNVVKGSLIK